MIKLLKKIKVLIFNSTRIKKNTNVDFGSNFVTGSYSQCGEDILVGYLFSLRGIKSPSYIDIGANHPWFINNTAFFYKKGCRGINIEPNQDLIPIFNKE